ncbi:MAG: gas vesicle protein GvpJ [Micromonosporaceae bacterium]|jgi:hypothetical protein
MTVVTNGASYVERPRASGLAEVVDLILDKGLVVDAFVRVSLLGLELLTVDARVVVASVDTYLRFAEAADRVVLGRASQVGVPDLLGGAVQGGAKSKVKGAAEGAKEALGLGGDGQQREAEREPQGAGGGR